MSKRVTTGNMYKYYFKNKKEGEVGNKTQKWLYFEHA